MKLAAIAITLLGTSSIAAAKPATFSFHADAQLDLSFGTRGSHAPSHTTLATDSARRPYRPHPAYDYPMVPTTIVPRRPLPTEGAWMSLGVVSTGKQTLSLANNRNRFDTLMLDVDGRVDLQQVLIVFTDKQQQLVKFDRAVRDEKLSIDLAGADRTIAGIIVYTAAARHGAVAVFGRDNARDTAPVAPRGWNLIGSIASGKQTLVMNDRYGKLVLVADGRITVTQVLVRYGNDRDKLVTVNRDMRDGSSIAIDLASLDRRPIVAIIVYSDTVSHGELTAYAR